MKMSQNYKFYGDDKFSNLIIVKSFSVFITKKSLWVKKQIKNNIAKKLFFTVQPKMTKNQNNIEKINLCECLSKITHFCNNFFFVIFVFVFSFLFFLLKKIFS